MLIVDVSIVHVNAHAYDSDLPVFRLSNQRLYIPKVQMHISEFIFLSVTHIQMKKKISENGHLRGKQITSLPVTKAKRTHSLFLSNCMVNQGFSKSAIDCPWVNRR